jgi:hypothetical protein
MNSSMIPHYLTKSATLQYARRFPLIIFKRWGIRNKEIISAVTITVPPPLSAHVEGLDTDRMAGNIKGEKLSRDEVTLHNPNFIILVPNKT